MGTLNKQCYTLQYVYNLNNKHRNTQEIYKRDYFPSNIVTNRAEGDSQKELILCCFKLFTVSG